MAGLTLRQKALKPSIRRLASKGWSADAIARAYKITRADVRDILATPVRPPPAIRTGAARPIWSRLATKVRRLLFEQGKTAAETAAELDLDPARVEDFLARLTPRQNHRRRQGATLNRPRSARELSALREWLPNRTADDRDGVMLPAVEVLDLVELPGLPPEPTAWEGGHASPNVGKVDGTPVRRGKARPKVRPRPKGDADRRVKLDAAAREEIRRLYAAGGISKRELARRFGGDHKTIRELLSGHTHAVDGVRPVPAPPPAPPKARPATWREPKGADLRSRGGAVERERDRVMLPAPEVLDVVPPAIAGPTAWPERSRGPGS
jgi:hypothetical protein